MGKEENNMAKAKEKAEMIIRKEKFPLAAAMTGALVGAGIGTLAVQLFGGSFEVTLIGLAAGEVLTAAMFLKFSWVLQEKVEKKE